MSNPFRSKSMASVAVALTVVAFVIPLIFVSFQIHSAAVPLSLVPRQLNLPMDDLDVIKAKSQISEISLDDPSNWTNAIATNEATQTNFSMAKYRQINGNRAMILHIGKAAGGTLYERLRRKWRLSIRKCHPKPCTKSLQSETSSQLKLLVTLRDPVDRFVSAFYWRAYVLCHRSNQSTGKLVEQAKSCPNDMYPITREVETLYHVYRLNATKLALELCSPNKTIRQKAIDAIASIQHARYSLRDWMNFDWSKRAQHIFPLVVERGMPNFEGQVDMAVHWLHNRTHYETLEAFERRRRTLELLDQTSLQSDPNQAHSSASFKRDISAQAEQCLVQYYRRDYELLDAMGRVACKTEACRQGIDSILRRRSALLNRQADDTLL